MDELWLIGRILFSVLFIGSGIGQLADIEGSTQYAASKGIEPAKPGVIATGVAFLVGGISILFGIWGDLGALLLMLTLLPVTFLMHRFWAERDPATRQMQMSQFMKNIALLGALAILFSIFARDTFGFGLPYTITDGAFNFR
ncbi:MAG: DoxX family protein [Ilumatobacteraceae bacterium]